MSLTSENKVEVVMAPPPQTYSRYFDSHWNNGSKSYIGQYYLDEMYIKNTNYRPSLSGSIDFNDDERSKIIYNIIQPFQEWKPHVSFISSGDGYDHDKSISESSYLEVYLHRNKPFIPYTFPTAVIGPVKKRGPIIDEILNNGVTEHYLLEKSNLSGIKNIDYMQKEIKAVDKDDIAFITNKNRFRSRLVKLYGYGLFSYDNYRKITPTLEEIINTISSLFMEEELTSLKRIWIMAEKQTECESLQFDPKTDLMRGVVTVYVLYNDYNEELYNQFVPIKRKTETERITRSSTKRIKNIN